MKRVALCLSGHMRSFKRTTEQWGKILSPYNVDVFIHTWDEYGWSAVPFGNHYQDSLFPNTGKINAKEVRDYFQPKDMVVEDYQEKRPMLDTKAALVTKLRELYDLRKDDRPHAAISQYYKIFHVNRLKKEYEDKYHFKYDVVIRSRPDVFVRQLPGYCFNGWPSLIFSPNIPPGGTHDFEMNDVIHIGRTEDMDKVANAFPDIQERALKCTTRDEANDIVQIHRFWYSNVVRNGLAHLKSFMDFEIVRQDESSIMYSRPA